jgi:X-Pro dipeptidyl-peptidase
VEGITRARSRGAGHRAWLWAVVALLAASLVGARGTESRASAEIDRLKSIQETYIVPTRYGKLYAEVVRPTRNGRALKVPAILTMSPYSVLGRNGDADEWWPRGYARVWVDVVGTGNSGGCYDYGGRREKQTGYDVVEWLASRRWSNGKVGMIGGSYNGTTAIATAVTRPPHLTTIVPEAAISRWYEYAFSGGIRYAWTNEMLGHQGPGSVADEGLDTPLAFDFGLAIPPPIDVTGADWADRVESTIRPCEELDHTLHGYDVDTPNYDKFWLERDYITDAGDIKIPVLIAHNWGDWNVKQEEAVNLYGALRNSPAVKLYMGTRWNGHGTPGHTQRQAKDYARTVRRWFDHYLMGRDNGIQHMPRVTSQTSDSSGPGRYHRGAWPNTRAVELIAQEAPKTRPNDYEWKLLPGEPRGAVKPAHVAGFPSTNVNTESHAAHHARLNHDWFWFESPRLKRDARIFGAIKVKLFSSAQRRWITYTPSIIDFDIRDHAMVGPIHVGATDPSAVVAVTRGWLDSRYRNSLHKQEPIDPGRAFGMTIVTKPQDYTFKKGHQIGLLVQTEINEWSVPKPYPGCDDAGPDCPNVNIHWKQGKTRLILPIVNAPRDPMQLFSTGHHHH